MTRVVPTTARERDRKQVGLRCCRYLRLLPASRFDRFILGRRRELRFESGLLQRGVSNEPCGWGVARGWDPEFESALLQRRVRNEPSQADAGCRDRLKTQLLKGETRRRRVGIP